MSFLEKLENRLSKPGRLSRRSVLGRLSRGCTLAIATIAGIGFYDTAYAANAACCNLAYPNNLCDFGCPCPNPNQWAWSCVVGFCVWTCGECYNCGCSYLIPHCGKNRRELAELLRHLTVPGGAPNERSLIHR